MKLQDYFDFEGVNLRLITDSDIDQTVAMINRGYEYQDDAKGRVRITAEELRQKAAEVEFYVGVQNGEIVACVYTEQKDKMLHLGLLTVNERMRGSGLGPGLMKAIERYAVSLGSKGLELEYNTIAFWLKEYYEKFGFSKTEDVINWGPLTGAKMTKKL